MKIVSIIALLGSLIFATAADCQTTALRGARGIDGTGGASIDDATIVMSDGRIVAIGPTAGTAIPSGAEVVDYTGKTIIPGIINAHSHISDDPALKLRHFALYGVTSTIGMGGDGDDVFKIRDEQRHGDIKGARAYTVQQRENVPTLAARFQGEQGQTVTAEKVVTLFTSYDVGRNTRTAALEKLDEVTQPGPAYDRLLQASARAWDRAPGTGEAATIAKRYDIRGTRP